MRRSLATFLLLLCVSLPTLAGAFSVSGLRAPDSFLVDAPTGHYFVSNVHGQPGLEDNNGFISKFDAQGKALDVRFITAGKNGVTLNAPRGMVIQGDVLYVTDIDTIRSFDPRNGQPQGGIDLSSLGVRSLTGIAAGPGGVLFVSDPAGNAIYRIDTAAGNSIQILVKDPRLGGPNGLVYDVRHDTLIVVTGRGQVVAVSADGAFRPLLGKSFGSLYGVDFDRAGNLIVSDFQRGRLIHIKNYSEVSTLKENLLTPAGIAYDYRHHRVGVPLYRGNAVFTLPLAP